MDLRKNLKFIDVFSVATGAMISSGIFILPGVAFANVGPAVFLSYFLAGVLALIGIVNVVELCTAMPRAGGDYYYIARSMGPFVGTVSGFMSWFALVLKSAFAIFGMAEVLYILTGIQPWMTEIVLTVMFVGVNLIGVKEAAILEVGMVVGLLAITGLYVLFGAPNVQVQHFDPFLATGKNAGSIVFTAGLVFISFGGLLKAASISEEVESPWRNIPLGIITSVLVVTFLYTLILIVTVGILPAAELKESKMPVADAAKIFAGEPGYWAITVAAILAFVTTANAGIMSAARYPFALGRDGLIPRLVTYETKKKGTPVFAITVTGAIILLALQLNLETMVKAASAVVLASYVLSGFAVIILRESRIQNYRPTFKAPFYPVLQIVGIVLFSWLIFDIGLHAIEVNLGVILLSVLVFYFYGRKSSREYALLLLLERITNKKLTSRGLEEELKEVIHSREGIIKDEFDFLVEEAPVLDLEGELSADELFHEVSDKLAHEVNVTPEKMYELLQEREEESSTVINHFVAIPHIIVEGEDIFKIFIVRCKGGISMSGVDGRIRAAFVITGTRDRRNQHLKSLAAIAQIIQSRMFEDRWLSARNENELRDVLLLGKRKRTS